jgi:hypothetical protein
MKYIAFPIEEVEELLKIARGEVMRYEDIIKTLPSERSSYVFELIKEKWKGKVQTFEEMLKFGKPCEEII